MPTATVTIGCKLPGGLILRLQTSPHAEKRVELNGANKSRVIGGFGITEDVEADFWDKWVALHPEFPAYKNGLIFAMKKSADAIKEAKVREGVLSGLEPIDPKKLPRGVQSFAKDD